ncbi:DUF2752 domain-containing protein [Daejeonella lutea]|uniref:DUF2752 domain-containing protein n=1 Tax=Daejeonella lutea TaxID=572036 RepID=A0A1T5BCK1_9SPHI|nr:Protein of unknown function [Daejeonella lutea]
MEWIENNLLRCVFKAITGADCPGCGFQRSLIYLIRGDFLSSFAIYPGLIPILLFGLWTILGTRYPVKNHNLITQGLFFLSVATVFISYILKLLNAGG